MPLPNRWKVLTDPADPERGRFQSWIQENTNYYSGGSDNSIYGTNEEGDYTLVNKDGSSNGGTRGSLDPGCITITPSEFMRIVDADTNPIQSCALSQEITW